MLHCCECKWASMYHSKADKSQFSWGRESKESASHEESSFAFKISNSGTGSGKKSGTGKNSKTAQISKRIIHSNSSGETSDYKRLNYLGLFESELPEKKVTDEKSFISELSNYSGVCFLSYSAKRPSASKTMDN